MDSIPRCITLILLVIIGGVFSGAETAYSYCNKARMKTLSLEGSSAAKRVCWIIDEYDKMLSTILILINAIHVSAAVISAVLFEKIFGAFGAVISTTVLTIMMFVFSETIPKNIARANSDSFALVVSYPMKVLCVALSPLSFLFIKLGDAVKNLLRKGNESPKITEDDFSDIIADVVEKEDGVLDPEEGQIIQSAIDFGNVTVRDVMVEKEKIRAVNISNPIEKIKSDVLDCNFSRMPVYKESVDNIIGVLQTNKFLEYCIKGNKNFSIKQFLVSPYQIEIDAHIDDVFSEMTKRRNHFAIVVDENKHTLGIVTMDDVLSQIVGDSSTEDSDD